MADRFDLDLLSEEPFEIDAQAAHLFKHPYLGLHDIYDVWTSDPLFYPAKPPALADVRRGRRTSAGRSAGPGTRRPPAPLPTNRLLRGRSGPR